MSTDSKPGDVLIPKVELQGDGGNIRWPAESILRANMYENMMSLGFMVKYSVIDTNDVLGNIDLRKGQWKGKFHFGAPGSETRKLDDLVLNSVKRVQDVGTNNAKTYELVLYNKHLYNNMTKLIQKPYEKTIGNIVKEVGKEIGIEKWNEFEDTKGVQKYLAQNFTADYLMHQLNIRAVSNQNASSLYFTFQNKDGHNFVTLEKLFQQQPMRKLLHQNAYGSKQELDVANPGQIINYLYPKANSFSNILLGARKQQTRDSGPGNHLNTSKDTNKRDSDYRSGGSASLVRGLPREYTQNLGHAHTIPSDRSYLPDDHLTKAFPDKQAYLAFITDNCLNVQIHGDTQYTAGKMLDIRIPRNQGTTGPTEPDPQLNGNMVVVGINHEIRGNRTSPRYICHMDLLKGSHKK